MGYYEQLIGAHRERGILVDSGLLLLLFVGLCDRGRIQTFKRTRMFTESDFDLLQGIVRRFDLLVTTPNILTEVSNLLGQLPDNLHAQYFATFARSLQEGVNEYYIPSGQLALQDHFPRLGLTDTGSSNKHATGTWFSPSTFHSITASVNLALTPSTLTTSGKVAFYVSAAI
jgi:hypothetical protein